MVLFYKYRRCGGCGINPDKITDCDGRNATGIVDCRHRELHPVPDGHEWNGIAEHRYIEHVRRFFNQVGRIPAGGSAVQKRRCAAVRPVPGIEQVMGNVRFRAGFPADLVGVLREIFRSTGRIGFGLPGTGKYKYQKCQGKARTDRKP